MKTLVLGIGSDILGDDGAGIHIARKVALLSKSPGVSVEESGATGLSLIERIKGYQRLIIADALMTEDTESGKIHRLELKDLAKTNGTVTPHEAALVNTIEIGNSLFPGEMPAEVIIFAIQTKDVKQVSSEMTPAVKAAVPKVVKMIMKELGN
jgi:hydrogenase maturation protease